MNLILYKSSCIVFIPHLAKCYFIKDHILICVIITGNIVSILNHGYTHNMLKILDRTFMFLFLIYHLINDRNYQFILYLNVLLYFYSKYTKNHKYHKYSHYGLMIYHLLQ